MCGIVTATVVAAGVGIYTAERSEDAAYAASRTASQATADTEAANRALNEERYEAARRGMDPFIQSSRTANQQLMLEMGMSNRFGEEDRYVPGRDPYMERPGSPGFQQPAQPAFDPINPDTGQIWTATDQTFGAQQNEIKQQSLEVMKNYSPEMGTPEEFLASSQGQSDLAGAGLGQGQTYEGEYSVDGGAYQTSTPAPGGSPYLGAPEQMDTNVIPGVQQDMAQLAPGGSAYLDPVTGEQMVSDFSALAPGQNLYRDPQESIDTGQYFSDLTAGWEAFTANPIYQQMIDAGAKTALGSGAAGGMANSGVMLERLRDVGQETGLGFFNTYMGTMGDLTGMNEARRMADMQSEEQRYANYLNIGEARGVEQRGINEQRYANVQNISEARRREALGYNEQRDINTQNINEQRFANYMNRDEQRMVNEQNTQESRYVNYMNMLQNMSSPATATNLASLGVNQGIAQAGQASQSVANINQYNLGATAAANAARADMAGGAMNLASAYIGSQGYNPASSTPYVSDGYGYGGYTGGTIYGGANAPRPTNYAGMS